MMIMMMMITTLLCCDWGTGLAPPLPPRSLGDSAVARGRLPQGEDKASGRKKGLEKKGEKKEENPS